MNGIGAQAGPYERIGLAFYLARAELARRYAGSLLGWAWALAFPAMLIALYWAVFSFGLRIGGGGGASFAVLLIAGMVAWTGFSDALTSMSMSLSGNAQLVKRLVLPAELLPAASLIGAGLIHGLILLAALAALAALGHPPGPDLILLPYYALCLAALAFPLGMLLALANVALRDIAPMVAPVLQLWFWATPIVWPARILPEAWHWAIALNPVHYVVEGYRAALVGSEAGAPGAASAALFWAIVLGLGLAARYFTRRYKSELADML